MRPATFVAAAVAILIPPSPSWSTSIATRTVRDPSGLPAPWGAAGIAHSDSSTYWSVGSRRLERTSAGGRQEYDLTEERLRAVFFPTPDSGWVVGDRATIFHTGDGGGRWQRQRAGLDDDLQFITCSDAEHCWISISEGGLLRTADGGRVWMRTASAARGLSWLFFLDSQLGWAIDGAGALLRTEDGGDQWHHVPVRLPGGESLKVDVVRFTDERLGWIGSANRIARTTDGGESWNVTLEIDPHLSFFALVSQDGHKVYAGVEGEWSRYEKVGGNYWSSDGGLTWEDVIDPDESADWEALIGDEHAPARMDRVFMAHVGGATQGMSWRASMAEALPGPQGARLRRVSVGRSASCSDVQVLAREEALPAALADWVGFAPCRLDAAAANSALTRFAFDAEARPLVVQCGPERKVFGIPEMIPRRRLGRVSHSLLALVELADRLAGGWWLPHGATQADREAGRAAVPLLLSGRFDTALARPSELRSVLADYKGPVKPLGRVGRVAVELPPGVTVPHQVPPAYPDIAFLARVEGAVTLDLALNRDTGEVSDVVVVSGIPLLDAASLEAVRHWRFGAAGMSPGTLRVVIRFSIDACAPGGQVS